MEEGGKWYVLQVNVAIALNMQAQPPVILTVTCLPASESTAIFKIK
jgi:hypothetical protein